jgi:hypothetical protein
MADDLKTEIASKSGLVVASAASAAAAAAAGGGPIPSALAALVPGLLDLASTVFNRGNARRVGSWFQELLKDPEFARLCEPQDGKSPLEQRLDIDFQFSELFHRALREVLSSVSPAAMRPLSRLLLTYVGRPEAAADEFFRGAAAVLSSFDAAQLDVLRDIASAATARPEAVPELRIHEGRLTFKDTEESESLGMQPAVQTSLRRVFHRLKVEGLGFDNPAGFFDSVSGPDVLRMEREIARRLVTVLEP